MTEYTGDSRFVRSEYGAAAPAQCLISGEARDLVDLGRTIPMYGRVYLSVDVIRELAAVAGITSPAERPWNREQLDTFVRKASDAADEFVAHLRTLSAGVDGSGNLVSAPADEEPVRKPRRKRAGTGSKPDQPVEGDAADELGSDSDGSSEGLDGLPGGSGDVRNLDDIRI